ncbi:hypothetical protein GGX14DRAFT_692378 [Mycena pura]|uniref:Protein kinase domain-containing protein n=1 Tax=Mycena pura TaxID=153505 RepID=A0AAD7E519_9AGAR|nr:hypothetical protein GGX14DRAFT_692378 [Mycena pura]
MPPNSRCGLALPLPANFDTVAHMQRPADIPAHPDMDLQDINMENVRREKANKVSLAFTRIYAAAAASPAGVTIEDVGAPLEPFLAYSDENKALLVGSKEVVDATGPLPINMTLFVASARMKLAEADAADKSKAAEVKLSAQYDLREARDTISRWRNRTIPSLPQLTELASVLEARLPEDQKICVPDGWLERLVGDDPENGCSKEDVRRLFRGGGGGYHTALTPIYSAVVRPPPDASTENGYIHFWDANISDLLHMLFFDAASHRNSSHSAMTKQYRPDFTFIYGNMCPYRGEETAYFSDQDPKAELSDKLARPWPYLDAPYILGYHAKGPVITQAAISPIGERTRTVVTDLVTYDLRRRTDRIKNMVALINMAPLLRGIVDLVPGVVAEFKKIQRDTCDIEIVGPLVIKTFKGEMRETEMNHLEKMYVVLEQRKVPHTDKPRHFAKDEYKVLLGPRGDSREPKTEDELLDAIICLLEMLQVLHKPPAFIHRDLRWPNVMRSFKDRREWFVIDWSDAVQTPAKAALKRDFDPSNHCPRIYMDDHGTEVDLWSVGWLIPTSRVREISPWLIEFGNSLRETTVTATEALQQIRKLICDEHRTSSPQGIGEAVQAPSRSQAGADSSSLIGEKRRAEDPVESVATKRLQSLAFLPSCSCNIKE